MTRGSVKEYLEAIKVRYIRGDRKEKSRILDEAVRVTGHHRKSLVRALRGGPEGGAGKRVERPKQYGPEAVAVLKTLWEASGRVCGKRLQPFLPELVEALVRHGELSLEGGLRGQVEGMSAATIDRLLKPCRQPGLRRPFSTTKPGSLLKGAILVRTFAEWEEKRPGFLEIDLVAHCGGSTERFYLTTLSAVDVATGWVECRGVYGKGQERVGGAIHHIGQHLPFPLLGADLDNGGEFINRQLYNYCQSKAIIFTPSRLYKKNDSAHIEQKNDSAPVNRLRPLQVPRGPGAAKPSLCPVGALPQLLPAGDAVASQESAWGPGPQGVRRRPHPLPEAAETRYPEPGGKAANGRGIFQVEPGETPPANQATTRTSLRPGNLQNPAPSVTPGFEATTTLR